MQSTGHSRPRRALPLMRLVWCNRSLMRLVGGVLGKSLINRKLHSRSVKFESLACSAILDLIKSQKTGVDAIFCSQIYNSSRSFTHLQRFPRTEPGTCSERAVCSQGVSRWPLEKSLSRSERHTRVVREKGARHQVAKREAQKRGS